MQLINLRYKVTWKLNDVIVFDHITEITDMLLCSLTYVANCDKAAMSSSRSFCKSMKVNFLIFGKNAYAKKEMKANLTRTYNHD